MSHTDPLADLLTRIRNAHMARRTEVEIPASKLKAAVLELLKSEGYIAGFSEKSEGAGKSLIVELKYHRNQPAIRGLQRISTTGRRVYRAASAIPKTQSGFGVVIVSTSQGLMSDREARKRGLGGEIMAAIW
jgi:small subunit ribosomal protein S8